MHESCSRALLQICGSQALLPQSLTIRPRYDSTKNPLYRGGFADVWEGQHDGRDVAVKGLRISSRDDYKRIRKVGRP